MIELINRIIRFINDYILFFNFRVYIPTNFWLPKDGEPVTIKHPHGFTMTGVFKDGVFVNYPAKYKPNIISAWSYNKPSFQIPEIPNLINGRDLSGVDVLLPLTKSVFFPRENIYVNTKMAKALQNDPMHTSLSDKREKVKKQSEKARNYNYQRYRKSPSYKVTEV